MADWIPFEADFTITGKDADELAASPDPEAWLKAYIRRKHNLPDNAELDLSGIKFAPARKSSEEYRKGERTTEKQDPLPTKVYDTYWIYAERRDKRTYPKPTERCGKWMIYVHVDQVDQVWTTIRDAVRRGVLGSSAKVATMKPNRNAVRPDEKVICIYTYDSEDTDDVVRILKALREELGLMHKAFYKEDEATLSGQYSFNTQGPVSKYWADSGETSLRIPKGR